MVRNSIVTLAAAVVLLGALTSDAREPADKTTPKPFAVCAGSCSRSMHVESKHESVEAAIRAANVLRDSKRWEHVGVSKGSTVRPLDVHPSFRANATPASISVYQVGCKSSSLRGTLTTVADADFLAKRITDDDGIAEVIFNYEK